MPLDINLISSNSNEFNLKCEIIKNSSWLRCWSQCSFIERIFSLSANVTLSGFDLLDEFQASKNEKNEAWLCLVRISSQQRTRPGGAHHLEPSEHLQRVHRPGADDGTWERQMWRLPVRTLSRVAGRSNSSRQPFGANARHLGEIRRKADDVRKPTANRDKEWQRASVWSLQQNLFQRLQSC